MSGRKQSQRSLAKSAPQSPSQEEQQSSSSSSLNVRFSQDSASDVEQQRLSSEQLRAASEPPATPRRQIFFPPSSTSSTPLSSQHSVGQVSTTSTDTVFSTMTEIPAELSDQIDMRVGQLNPRVRERCSPGEQSVARRLPSTSGSQTFIAAEPVPGPSSFGRGLDYNELLATGSASLPQPAGTVIIWPFGNPIQHPSQDQEEEQPPLRPEEELCSADDLTDSERQLISDTHNEHLSEQGSEPSERGPWLPEEFDFPGDIAQQLVPVPPTEGYRLRGYYFLVSFAAQTADEDRYWQRGLANALIRLDNQLCGYEYAFEIGRPPRFYQHYHVLLHFKETSRGYTKLWKDIFRANAHFDKVKSKKDVPKVRLYLRKQQQRPALLCRYIDGLVERMTPQQVAGLPMLKDFFVTRGEFDAFCLPVMCDWCSSEDLGEQFGVYVSRRRLANTDQRHIIQVLSRSLTTRTTVNEVIQDLYAQAPSYAVERFTTIKAFVSWFLDCADDDAAVREVQQLAEQSGITLRTTAFKAESFNTPMATRLHHAYLHTASQRRILWVASPPRFGKSSWAKAIMPDPLIVHKNEVFEDYQKGRNRSVVFDDYNWDMIPLNDVKLLLDTISSKKSIKVRYKNVNLPAGGIFSMVVLDNHLPVHYFNDPTNVDHAAALARIDAIELTAPLFNVDQAAGGLPYVPNPWLDPNYQPAAVVSGADIAQAHNLIQTAMDAAYY